MTLKLNEKLATEIIEFLDAMPLPDVIEDIPMTSCCIETEWFKAGWLGALGFAAFLLSVEAMGKAEPSDQSLN